MRPVLEKIGANVDQLEQIVDAELAASAQSERRRAAEPQSGAAKGARRRPGRGRRHEGRVRLDRAHAARPHRHQVQSPGRALAQRDHQRRRARCAACRPRLGPRHRPVAGGQIPGPRKIWHRPRRAGPPGQSRPRDRPRPGDSPRDPGALAPHQEQPRADRRAGRRQDGDRRGARAADRAGRRAAEPQEPPRDRAGHGRARGRHEVPRRIRRAAQGTA